jgi:hypothetical protein
MGFQGGYGPPAVNGDKNDNAGQREVTKIPAANRLRSAIPRKRLRSDGQVGSKRRVTHDVLRVAVSG